MNRIITCIECPLGCKLSVDIENSNVIKVSGNKCPKGFDYAKAEVENPKRILTSTVVAEGLSSKMVSARTSGSIPKSIIPEAMSEIKLIVIKKPVKTGDVIVKNFLDTGSDLVCTRTLDR